MTFSIDQHDRFVEQASWTVQAQQLFLKNASITSERKILEVGCGTGALLSSMARQSPAEYYGLDIQFDLSRHAYHLNPAIFFACGDAFSLPFSDETFDAIVCHYFLLWTSEIDLVLKEIRRVILPGGYFAALAEPDYGSRIDFPESLVTYGKMQRESLKRQGADPDIGRKLGFLFYKNGFENISQGILGSFQSTPPGKHQLESEQQVLLSDIGHDLDSDTKNSIVEIDTDSRTKNVRVQFIPTFFVWGTKP